MSLDSSTAAPPKPRPWHLWVAGILALLWNLGGAFDYLMNQTGNETYLSQITPEQREFFRAFPAWVVAAWAIAVWGGLLGVVLLLARRRFAVPVLWVSFLAMLVTAFRNFVLADGIKVIGGTANLVFTAVIFLAALALPLYAMALAKRGVLV
jgi:hypothetical protein